MIFLRVSFSEVFGEALSIDVAWKSSWRVGPDRKSLVRLNGLNCSALSPVTQTKPRTCLISDRT